jgi:6-phosphogluconolactonase
VSGPSPPVGTVRLVDDVAAAFTEVVAAEAPASFALSGGGTARRCYQALAAAGSDALDWSGVTVLFGDERWVPVSSPDSNEGMARRVLLDAVAPAEVRSLRGAGASPEEAAVAYDTALASLPGPDVVHLGLGDDGNTASLFPGSPALAVDDRLVVATGDGAHPHRRLTFTFPAIARARLVIVTVSGAAKVEAWRRLCRGDDVPAARIRAERVCWLVDPAAAGGNRE